MTLRRSLLLLRMYSTSYVQIHTNFCIIVHTNEESQSSFFKPAVNQCFWVDWRRYKIFGCVLTKIRGSSRLNFAVEASHRHMCIRSRTFPTSNSHSGSWIIEKPPNA